MELRLLKQRWHLELLADVLPIVSSRQKMLQGRGSIWTSHSCTFPHTGSQPAFRPHGRDPLPGENRTHAGQHGMPAASPPRINSQARRVSEWLLRLTVAILGVRNVVHGDAR